MIRDPNPPGIMGPRCLIIFSSDEEEDEGTSMITKPLQKSPHPMVTTAEITHAPNHHHLINNDHNHHLLFGRHHDHHVDHDNHHPNKLLMNIPGPDFGSDCPTTATANLHMRSTAASSCNEGGGGTSSAADSSPDYNKKEKRKSASSGSRCTSHILGAKIRGWRRFGRHHQQPTSHHYEADHEH
eukprot:Protomagalhaensia_sp_Gyna_25__3303@NODE_299_length_4005_cov_944_097075_g231_i0_p2_GENE_NODE_299_length_4005_cov_944_097075_g231_i0NODE_299_length_4005_cov_944_097075_g231_i0_p2_ORF_typecomplete_len184_score31_30DUF4592/PF15262_6/0_54NicO/PF03824_16/0_51NicO/PF03824_16/1_3e02_NODE_299_length_4005_cov_944_097075_g231_i016362187